MYWHQARQGRGVRPLRPAARACSTSTAMSAMPLSRFIPHPQACCPTSPPTHIGGSSNNSCNTPLLSTTTPHAPQPRSTHCSPSSHTIKPPAPCAASPRPRAPSSIPRSLPTLAPPPPPDSPHPPHPTPGTQAPTSLRPRSHRPATPSLSTLPPLASRTPSARPRSCLRRSLILQQPCLPLALGIAWQLDWALRLGN